MGPFDLIADQFATPLSLEDSYSHDRLLNLLFQILTVASFTENCSSGLDLQALIYSIDNQTTVIYIQLDLSP